VWLFRKGRITNYAGPFGDPTCAVDFLSTQRSDFSLSTTCSEMESVFNFIRAYFNLERMDERYPLVNHRNGKDRDQLSVSTPNKKEFTPQCPRSLKNMFKGISVEQTTAATSPTLLPNLIMPSKVARDNNSVVPSQVSRRSKTTLVNGSSSTMSSLVPSQVAKKRRSNKSSIETQQYADSGPTPVLASSQVVAAGGIRHPATKQSPNLPISSTVVNNRTAPQTALLPTDQDNNGAKMTDAVTLSVSKAAPSVHLVPSQVARPRGRKQAQVVHKCRTTSSARKPPVTTTATADDAFRSGAQDLAPTQNVAASVSPSSGQCNQSKEKRNVNSSTASMMVSALEVYIQKLRDDATSNEMGPAHQPGGISIQHLQAAQRMIIESVSSQRRQCDETNSIMTTMLLHSRPAWEDLCASIALQDCFAVCWRNQRIAVDNNLTVISPNEIFDPRSFLRNLQQVTRDDTIRGTSAGLLKENDPNASNTVKDTGTGSKGDSGFGEGCDTESTAETPDNATPLVLPIDEHKEKILATIESQQVTIIKGETGCGKVRKSNKTHVQFIYCSARLARFRRPIFPFVLHSPIVPLTCLWPLHYNKVHPHSSHAVASWLPAWKTSQKEDFCLRAPQNCGEVARGSFAVVGTRFKSSFRVASRPRGSRIRK
jgi:hypothetical protein